MRLLYRYTTQSGEGTFSATRQFLNDQSLRIIESIVQMMHRNADWLLLPHIPEPHLEFYFTEKGRELFEASLKAVQETCVGQVELITVLYEELQGAVLYEDPYQIAIRAPQERQLAVNPYQNRAQYCF